MPGTGAARVLPTWALPTWVLLAWVLLALPPSLAQTQPSGRRWVTEKEARFDTTYTDWVGADLINIYAFNHSVRRNRVSRRSSRRGPLPPWAPRPLGSPRSQGFGAGGGDTSSATRAEQSPAARAQPAVAGPAWPMSHLPTLPADGGGAGVGERPLRPQGFACPLRGEAEGGRGLLPGAAHPPGPVSTGEDQRAGRGAGGLVGTARHSTARRTLCLPRYQRKYAYQEVSRTLCQPQTKAEVETQHFYVDVSTLSLNASYQLRVTRVENFVLR